MAKKASKTPRMKSGPATDDDGYEILGGGSGTDMEVGEVHEGTFYGAPRSIPSKRKGEPPVPLYLIGERTVLGGTILRSRIEEGGVQPGDGLKITRLEDLPGKKGQNPAKNWDVRVKRITSKGFIPKPRELGAGAPKGKRRA